MCCNRVNLLFQCERPMTSERPSYSKEDYYARQARKLEEFERAVFFIIASVAGVLLLLNLWQPTP